MKIGGRSYRSIRATAACGVALHMRADPSDAGLVQAIAALTATRPTAVNLPWALEDMQTRPAALPVSDRPDATLARAPRICDEDVAINAAIGRHGLRLIEEIAARKQDGPVNVLTHGNAGWLAKVDWGTATAPICIAPIYIAHDPPPRNRLKSFSPFRTGLRGRTPMTSKIIAAFDFAQECQTSIRTHFGAVETVVSRSRWRVSGGVLRVG